MIRSNKAHISSADLKPIKSYNTTPKSKVNMLVYKILNHVLFVLNKDIIIDFDFYLISYIPA